MFSVVVAFSFHVLASGDAQFAAFVQKHARDYQVDSEEYAMRLAHFNRRVADVEAHNAQPDRLWTAGVNVLADRTPAELAMLRGYRHSEKKSTRTTSLGLASVSSRVLDMSKLPTNFTWKGHLAAMDDVSDQGGCGSCWAISSATVLRAFAELYQTDRTFSTQQIVECTPNPQECGGQGGCNGATAELAMDYVAKAGLLTEEAHQYHARDGKCAAQMQLPKSNSVGSISKHVASFGEFSSLDTGGAAFGMHGWEKLPENAMEPLLLAVYEKGPVVVSVAATDDWSMYHSGVMKACTKEAVLNHAVVLVGFGEDAKLKKPFYHIQNSWGNGWGEGGFIRMERHSHAKEGDYCGWDKKPGDGTACKGGPSKVWICGSCGVLYDSVVPTFALSENGFLSRHTRDAMGVFTQVGASTATASRNLRH